MEERREERRAEKRFIIKINIPGLGRPQPRRIAPQADCIPSTNCTKDKKRTKG